MFKFIKLMGALPSEGWWVNHNKSDQGLLNRYSQYKAQLNQNQIIRIQFDFGRNINFIHCNKK